MRLEEELILRFMNYAHPRHTAIDRRLIEVFGEEQCLLWQQENPDFLRYQCFELASGFIIIDHDQLQDQSTLEPLESLDPVNFPDDELELITIGVFNPMRYNIKRSVFARKYYSIGKTGKVLVLYSREELRSMYNSKVA